MRTSIFKLGAALAVALAAAALIPATSAASRNYWKGRPEIQAGEVKGYFIWEDEGGFHARWTTKGGRAIFKGTITTDGEFMQFEAVKKDERDLIKKESDRTIQFDTRTEGGVDGLDFRVSPSTRNVRFDLKIDGVNASPQSVRLGASKERPASVPFTIDRTGRSGTTTAAADTKPAAATTTKGAAAEPAPAKPKPAPAPGNVKPATPK